LLSFLKDNGSEVENMLFTEWNMKDALEVAKEEGEARGREEGEARGMEKGEAKARQELFALLESGISLAEAKRKFGY
jgi:predicted transposase YdaD